LTSSPSDVRKGSQRPRIESYPLYSTSAGDDAVDLAALAGLVLDPWQEHVLRHSLGEKLNGKWSAFRVALVVPRQNGKNALLEARELAGLFLFGEKRIIHTAHEVKTARESMQSLMNRLKQSDELMSYVAGFDGDFDKDISGMKTGNDPSITLKNGNKLSYAARSKGSGRGFTGDLIVMDEAYALRADEMAAMVPTMAARSMVGNPQLWFTSSAGMPESDLLNAVRGEGIARSSNRLAYFEWSADDDADINDVNAWYEANPGLGVRISEQYVLDELETMLSDPNEGEEKFLRERLGVWAKLGPESAFPKGLWAKRGDGTAAIESDLVVAVDIRTGLNAAAAIVLAGSTAEDYAVADLVFQETGAGAEESSVFAEAMAFLERRGLDAVAIDGTSENASLISLFENADVKVTKLNTRDMANAAVGVTDSLMTDRLRHRNQNDLNAAVKVAGKRKYGTDTGLYLWSQDRSSGDITALRAWTVAAWVHRTTHDSDYDVMDSFF
jgi:phage terminase large subunit-like protein